MGRVAIWVHGGIGGGHFSQGQPPIQQLVTNLSRGFAIDVYSLLPPNKDFVPDGYRMVYPPWQGGWRPLGWIYLVLKFIVMHFRKPYHLMYAFWGYPAGSMAVVTGRLFRIPSVVHLQGGDAVKIPSLKYGVFNHPVRAAICRYTYSRCSRLIVLSQFHAECLKSNHVSKAAMVVPFGPDTSKFFFVPERFDQPVVRFLHVANQTPLKRQDIMLRVFSIVAGRYPSHLVIVGEDYYNGKLKALCRSLGIEDQVEFLGPQPHHLMPGFYHRADILLHTPEFEGQGLVFAEAAACGTLLAGTSVGMLADMGEKCGLIVKPGDYNMLADKILTLLSSKSAYKEMQRSARHWIQEKDVNYTVTEIKAVLNELIRYADSKRPQGSFYQTKR